jgi:Ca2+-binding RTX toxin-like protein
VNYSGATAGIDADLAAGTASGQGTDVLSSIENLIGSDHNDTLAGNGVANLIRGGTGDDEISGRGGNDTLRGEDGSDTLSGGAGRDRLFGGADNDTLTGGAGNDTLAGGGGNDTFIYSFGEGNDTVTNVVGGVMGSQEILQFTDISAEQLSFERQGSDVLIHIHTLTGGMPIVNTITVKSWFSAVGAKLDQVEATDHTFTSQEIENLIAPPAPPPAMDDFLF